VSSRKYESGCVYIIVRMNCDACTVWSVKSVVYGQEDVRKHVAERVARVVPACLLVFFLVCFLFSRLLVSLLTSTAVSCPITEILLIQRREGLGSSH
jgi:hypothetical protein